jgi:hypothetical protein
MLDENSEVHIAFSPAFGDARSDRATCVSFRRRQYAIRREDGRYVLAEGGLNMVPHGKGSQGSDVARAPALGRKQAREYAHRVII